MEGNQMKMREALVALRDRFSHNVMAYQDRYFKFSGWHWHKKAAEAAKWRDVFQELKEVCDAALSEPPRNCDLVNSYDEAEEKFGSYCVQYETCRACSLLDPKDCRARWLLATATSTSTKKGDN